MSSETAENGDVDSKRLQQLIAEQQKLQSMDVPHTLELINEEISRLQGKHKDTPKYLDVLKDKPINVSVKVLVPQKDYPNFNFKGKLLGPMGNTMKRLQEETMTKMAIRGKGSMKDKSKEDELRKIGDSKYDHLNEDLHVGIATVAPCAEAYARISYALVEIQKYLIPDAEDHVSYEQMQELNMLSGGVQGNGMIPSEEPLLAPPRSAISRGSPRGVGMSRAARGMQPPIRRAMRRPMASPITATPLYQRRGQKPGLLSTPAIIGDAVDDESYTAGFIEGAYRRSFLEKPRYRLTPY